MVAHVPEGKLLDQFLAAMKTADGVFAVGEDQRIVHWGETAEEILGHQTEAALGHACQDIIGGRDARNLRFCRRNCPIVRNARKGRPTRDYDILVRTSDGTAKWINVSLLIVQDKERHTTSLVHIFRDVTHRRKLEEQARRTGATLRDLIADEEAPVVAELPVPAAVPELTPRETEVLRLLVMGRSTPEIAANLGISPITARNHITNLQTKLGVKNRLQAVLYASQHQLI